MKELTEEKESIEELKIILNKDRKRLKEIELEMNPLNTFLETAQNQRDAIKEEISMYFWIYILLLTIR